MPATSQDLWMTGEEGKIIWDKIINPLQVSFAQKSKTKSHAKTQSRKGRAKLFFAVSLRLRAFACAFSFWVSVCKAQRQTLMPHRPRISVPGMFGETNPTSEEIKVMPTIKTEMKIETIKLMTSTTRPILWVVSFS